MGVAGGGWVRVWFFSVVAILIAAAPVSADTTVLMAAADTTVFSEDGALSNGAGQHMFCGRTKDDFLRRALVRFDVAAGIPPGAAVTAVTLTLNHSRTKVGDLDVSLHRGTSQWGESGSDAAGEEGTGAAAETGDATWTHAVFATNTWTAVGGDFAASASATTAVPQALGPQVWSSAQMVIDVQGWLDGPATNFGWVMIAPTAANGEAKRFDTHDHPTSAVRPQLEITFTPPASAGACCDAAGACTVTLDVGSCAGNYQGDGTACTANPCPEPVGACCHPVASATCIEQTALECDGADGTFHGPLTSCAVASCPVVLTPFLDALPIPVVAKPVSGTVGGAAEYRLSIVELKQQLHSELPPTTVWGYDDGMTGGTFPGPTIEATTEQPITVVWANDLRDASTALRTEHVLAVDRCPHGAEDDSPRTVTHLHGGHVQAAFDGYPEDAYLPGQELTYEYPNWQQPATLWYHDHALGITRLNVYMGLAGFYLIRNAAEALLGLPSGEFEVPLVIQDRQVFPDGSLSYPADWQEHFFGDLVMVNGVVWPYLEVKRGKYRFRILNGSNARVYRLSLSNQASFDVIGSDGGLLAAPAATSELLLAPGERADIVIDFAGYGAGTEIILENDAPAPYPGVPGVGVVPNVMKFRVLDVAGHMPPLPLSLAVVAPLAEGDAVATRDFILKKRSDPCTGTAWAINGLRWNDITEAPRLGTSEVWTFINDSGAVHPMHMHLVFFQILGRQNFEMIDDVPTPTGALPLLPHENGWKDTVLVGPHEMVRVIARFEDFVGKFPYHCHILEHEDHDMMRQFETVTTCGDGARGIPAEECDDGNTVSGDGCSPICTLESPGADAGPSASPDARSTRPGTPDDDSGCGCGTTRGTGSVPLGVFVIALIGRRRRAGRTGRCP